MILCLVGKYPPVQGGVSSQMYWLARVLAELGHQVHFVTNADEVELSYCMYISQAERPRLECQFPGAGPPLSILRASRETPLTFLMRNPFVTKLAALAADVITIHRCEIITHHI